MAIALGRETSAPWLDATLAEVGDDRAERARTVAGVAVSVARHLGVRLPDLRLLSAWGEPRPVRVPAGAVSPWSLGEVHQSLLGRGRRRQGGVFYTPPEMAATVSRWALGVATSPVPVVADPAVGGGSFLLAAGEQLVRRGLSRGDAVAHHLVGIDVDPVAAAVCEAALSIWAGGAAVPEVIVADALTLPEEAWPAGLDVVVGNPPFLNQLGRATARRGEEAAELRRRFGSVAGGYADTAALFLVLGTAMVVDGGSVAMVMPRSFLATRHAGAARRAVLADASLESLWLPDDGGFDASVRVCVPVLRKGGSTGEVRRFAGTPPRRRRAAEADRVAIAAAPTWSHLAADDEAGVPSVAQLRTDGVLGAWCEATADFRDQYYGMAPFVVDDPDDDLDDASFAPLVTSGLIDPARCRWGGRPVRYHKRCWQAPRVDLARLRTESGLGRWDQRRLVPKVLVATQTRVIEAVVDERGTWLPSTPVITVTTSPERLWHAAAVLLAPAVAAWALRSFGGAALSASAIKLSASQVRSLPTPAGREAWDEAAVAVREASAAATDDARLAALLRAGRASSRAYGIDDPAVTDWWAGRLPTRP
jgi:hypothetical protein